VEEQVAANKLPCAVTAYKGTVKDSLTITSLVGKASKLEVLQDTSRDFTYDYFKTLEEEAYDLGTSLSKDVDGKTAFPVFDAYVKQSYMDNLLRGGYPLVFEGKEGPIVYHVYSRIHGDMEREYNDFNVEPAFFSQGRGNFRDVNQNRRNDIYFVKEAGKHNIVQFMELLQVDGQNPLSVKGSLLHVSTEDKTSLLSRVKSHKDVIDRILSTGFTPGSVLTAIVESEIELDIDKNLFLEEVIKKSTQENQAAYGHGYWVDHWTYNMDLVDNYLNIYPDKLEDLLYNGTYKYFLSPAVVLPREDKYVLNGEGKVRQYDSAFEDRGRIEALKIDEFGTNWQKTHDGDIYETDLFVKLLTLTINKITNMDQSGIGLMMNSDKPGWNDAMNGLPGLFGSGTSETIELNRIVKLLLEGCEQFPRDIELPKELMELLNSYIPMLTDNLNNSSNELKFWEEVQDVKETYIKSISLGISSPQITFKAEDINSFLRKVSEKIANALEKAINMGNGIIPSYLVHEALSWEEIPGKTHPINGMKNVTVSNWSVRALPLYLEAPARYLEQLDDKDIATNMYNRIKKSEMYDEKLGMYVTSESLEDESMEIGRARAFTPGWLEREAVFMHMEYKYLLGLLKVGLYDEFFETIKTALPPFMDPAVYGRSTLENSSFIASSRNPNKKNHGRGFVSRLTGTTSEMITMWLEMMTGMEVFKMNSGELNFCLHPILPSEFFDDGNSVTFTLLGDITVKYNNHIGKNTYGVNSVKPVSYKIIYKSGDDIHLKEVKGKHALDIRDGKVKQIIVDLA